MKEDKTFWQIFSQNLRRARKAAGLTQKEMAERLDFTRPAYTYYETGKYRPSLETVLRIALILDVPVESLFPPGGAA